MKPSRLILDTHLLVLLLVGSYDRDLIRRHKRCSDFDEVDLDLLLAEVARSSGLLLLPHVLAEASSLIRLIGDPIRTALSHHLSRFMAGQRESYVRSAAAADHEQHGALGLTDCVMLVGRKDATLLTKDFDLYRSAQATGRKVVNFTHLRERLAPRF